MGLISETNKKSKIIDNPELTINPYEKKRLIQGEMILSYDVKSKNPYIVRLDPNKIGSEKITHKDLIVERVKLQKGGGKRHGKS